MIRKCFLLRPMAKRVSRLLGPWRNIFACLQPAVDCVLPLLMCTNIALVFIVNNIYFLQFQAFRFSLYSLATLLEAHDVKKLIMLFKNVALLLQHKFRNITFQ